MEFLVKKYAYNTNNEEAYLCSEKKVSAPNQAFGVVPEIVESNEYNLNNIIIILRVSPSLLVSSALESFYNIFLNQDGYYVCFHNNAYNSITHEHINRIYDIHTEPSKSPFKDFFADILIWSNESYRKAAVHGLKDYFESNPSEVCRIINQFFEENTAFKAERQKNSCKKILIVITSSGIESIQEVVNKIYFPNINFYINLVEVIDLLDTAELIEQYFERDKEVIIQQVSDNDYESVKSSLRRKFSFNKDETNFDELFDKAIKYDDKTSKNGNEIRRVEH